MTDEKMTPERAVRLLRAKNGELEALVLRAANNPGLLDNAMHMWKLTADIALLFAIVADYIEGNLPKPEVQEAMKQFKEGFDEGRPDA